MNIGRHTPQQMQQTAARGLGNTQFMGRQNVQMMPQNRNHFVNTQHHAQTRYTNTWQQRPLNQYQAQPRPQSTPPRGQASVATSPVQKDTPKRPASTPPAGADRGTFLLAFDKLSQKVQDAGPSDVQGADDDEWDD